MTNPTLPKSFHSTARLGLFGLLLLTVDFSLLSAERPTLTLTIPQTHSTTMPTLRSLHGINKGPIAQGGLLHLTPQLKDLRIPFIRLHDCQWPYPDIVDMHAIFRNPKADPQNPENYDFKLTDEYLEATIATGAQIVYRLGESIEHGRVKRFVHPPNDFQRWAETALGVIRHYNEGWASGFDYRIRYWEIWNEPENRPAMWSGTDQDYFRLYEVASRAIHKHDPQLKVGGPSVGDVGSVRDGHFEPSRFTKAFLEYVKARNLPLHFFSWHTYTDSPQELVDKARGVRNLLDALGFQKTESHLNEWNYLPDRSWDGISAKATPAAREAYYQRMAGAEGAAFVARALMMLQDAPVDMCNLFHGEVGPFGLFSEQGAPQPNAAAWSAFSRLGERPRIPLQIQTDSPIFEPINHNVNAIATQSRQEGLVRILVGISSPQGIKDPSPIELEVQWTGARPGSNPEPAFSWSFEALDSEKTWRTLPAKPALSPKSGLWQSRVVLNPPAVCLITFPSP